MSEDSRLIYTNERLSRLVVLPAVALQAAMADACFTDLEQVVNDALWETIDWAEFWDTWGDWAEVQKFGSRVYGLATGTSDFDYYIEIPASHGRMAKVVRARVHRFLINRHSPSRTPTRTLPVGPLRLGRGTSQRSTALLSMSDHQAV